MSSDGFEAKETVIGKSDAYIKVEPLAISVVCAYIDIFLTFFCISSGIFKDLLFLFGPLTV